jgi:tRNA(Ile)-lysidine synthase
MNNTSDLLDRFLQFSTRHSLFSEGEHILLAVSGGIDSVVLAHLFHEAGITCGIAHCNFQLRAHESEADREFTEMLASRLGMAYHEISFDTAVWAKEQGLSIQMAARELRYSFFRKIAEEEGYSRIALAHHADDQVETLLINLGRGSGIRGLRGMPLSHKPFIRPLLFARREELMHYAIQKGLIWREDSSNEQHYYQRNRIRHEAIPLLNDIIPGFAANVLDSASHLAESFELLQHLLSGMRDHVEAKKCIELHKLPAQPELASALTKELLKPYGFSASEAIDALSQAQGSRVIGHRYIAEKGDGIIYLLPADAQENLPEPTWIEDGWQGENKDFHLRFTLLAWNPEMKPDPDPAKAFLDLSRLEYPLLLRHWEPGDRMKPLGMKGTKLLSDLFGECGVPVHKRGQLPILVSKGEICWVAGLRLSEYFKVQDDCKNVLLVELMIP